MSIESKHPSYDQRSDDWRQMRDTFEGERAVKEGTFAYLPATSGQVADGALNQANNAGWLAYRAYLTRAVFPDFVRDAVATMVGVLHSEPAVIKLPAALEPMRDNATRRGESLQMLLRKINQEQLIFGRFGMLADFPQDVSGAVNAVTPHIVQYSAETIINWDDERATEYGINDLSFLVTNETVQTRGAAGVDLFDWMEERRFRVSFLEAMDPEFDVSASNPIVYKSFAENDDFRSPTVIPAFMGVTLGEIPWVFVGANDLNPEPDEIPLLGLSNLSLTIYRGEADYRQNLFMQGQDTLVLIGELSTPSGEKADDNEAVRTGAGSVLRMNEGEGVKAEYIGVNSKGLLEQRSALQNDRNEAQSKGARLLEPRGSQAESGEALKIRVAASTADLHTIALTSAAGLEKLLKICAKWVGANPDEVSVEPNTDFTQETPDPKLLVDMMEAKLKGAPLSIKSIHKWAQDRNYTKMTTEDELVEIDKEEPLEQPTQPTQQPVQQTPDSVEPDIDGE